MFKITGKLIPDKVKLNKHYIWYILEVDWKEIKVKFNGKVINLPKSITVKIWDKFKVRHMMESQLILFHLMLKQGFNWFTLALKEWETETSNKINLILQKWQERKPQYATSSLGQSEQVYSGCRFDY